MSEINKLLKQTLNLNFKKAVEASEYALKEKY